MACVGSRITVLASRLAFRGACSSPSLTRALTSSIAMPPKASAAGKTTQQGLGAFLQKGVKMVDHIKVDVPKASAENGDKSAAGTRTSGRKRTTKAEADAKAKASTTDAPAGKLMSKNELRDRFSRLESRLLEYSKAPGVVVAPSRSSLMSSFLKSKSSGCFGVASGFFPL